MMVLIYSTAHHKIRAQCFEAFWYTHHLAFFFMIALYTHATGCFVRDSADPDYIPTFPFYSTEHCLGYESWRFIIWPGIIYFGERVYREIRARRATRLSKLLVHPSGLPDTHFLSHILSKPQLLQVPWNFASSSPALSTPQASGCSSRFPMSPVGNGIQLVSQFLHDDARTQNGFSSLSRLLQRTHTFRSTSVRPVIGPRHLASVLVLDHLLWLLSHGTQ